MGAERQLKPDAWLLEQWKSWPWTNRQSCSSMPSASPAYPVGLQYLQCVQACACVCILESFRREGGLQKVQRHQPRVSVCKSAGFSRERDLLQGGSGSRLLTEKRRVAVCTKLPHKAATRCQCKSTKELLTWGWGGKRLKLQRHWRSSCRYAHYPGTFAWGNGGFPLMCKLTMTFQSGTMESELGTSRAKPSQVPPSSGKPTAATTCLSI